MDLLSPGYAGSAPLGGIGRPFAAEKAGDVHSAGEPDAQFFGGAVDDLGAVVRAVGDRPARSLAGGQLDDPDDLVRDDLRIGRAAVGEQPLGVLEHGIEMASGRRPVVLGRPRRVARPRRIGEVRGAFGEDAGMDDRRVDSERFDVPGERLRQRVKSGLGDRVRPEVRRDRASRARPDPQQQPPALPAQVRQHRAGDPVRPRAIGRVRAHQLIRRESLGDSVVHVAGVVDEHIKTPGPLDDAANRSVHRRVVEYVQLERAYLTVNPVAERGGSLGVRPVGVPHRRVHGVAPRGERPGGESAHTRSGASNEHGRGAHLRGGTARFRTRRCCHPKHLHR